jgi:hypothetical protein
MKLFVPGIHASLMKSNPLRDVAVTLVLERVGSATWESEYHQNDELSHSLKEVGG